MALYLGKELAGTTEWSITTQNQPTGDFLKWRGGPILAQVWDDSNATTHGLRLTPVTGDNYAWFDVDGPGGGFYHHFDATIGDRANQKWIGIYSASDGTTAGLRMQALGTGVLVPMTISQDNDDGYSEVYFQFSATGDVAGSGAATRLGVAHELVFGGTGAAEPDPEARLYAATRTTTAYVARLQPYGTAAAANKEVGFELVPLGTSGIASLRLYGDSAGDIDTSVALVTFKATVAHDTADPALFNAAALTDSAVVWTQPAQTILLGAKMMLDEQFVAGSLTDLDVWIGDAGDNDGLMAQSMNLTSDTVAGDGYDTKGAYWNGVNTATYWASATKDWTAYATAVGANLNTLSAGQVTFYFFYIRLGFS